MDRLHGALVPALFSGNHTRRRYAFSAICLSVWWLCTGAFLPACARQRYVISAISLSLHGGLVPAPSSRHVRGKDKLFLRYLYLCMVASYRHLSPGTREEEIHHFCESVSLYGGLVPAPFSRHMRGRDTPFLRSLYLCMVASYWLLSPGTCEEEICDFCDLSVPA
jgi:hypothetical protein